MRYQLQIATRRDRQEIYRLRHRIYAEELHQHPINAQKELRDSLDKFNIYISVSLKNEIAGFISITPPGHSCYSIDKYFDRKVLPWDIDDQTFEVRILTVIPPFRRRIIAVLLMYAAFRFIDENGGKRIIAIGRQNILKLYRNVGLQICHQSAKAGMVTYALMTNTVENFYSSILKKDILLRKIQKKVDWKIDYPFFKQSSCFHGGSFFKAIGEEFGSLNRRNDIINADVLDAWFPPSPRVTKVLCDHLPWLIRTSPPNYSEGLTRVIARQRGVQQDNILTGAGSSALIFLALRTWLSSKSKVLILDPTYSEYSHVLEKIIGCQLDRFDLPRSENYRCDIGKLTTMLHRNHYDLVVLVNPNSPTGQFISREEMINCFMRSPQKTIFWVDETYIEYIGSHHSLEQFASQSDNIIVCKSMSKVYALSGLRVAYLCASPHLLEALRSLTPPWSVSLPAQVAAATAISDPFYYHHMYRQTHFLKASLANKIARISGIEVICGVTNFLLCHLDEKGPTAETIVRICKSQNVFLRDAGSMGKTLGNHALRISVKDTCDNQKIAQTLECILKK